MLTTNKKYICKNCHKNFITPTFFEEKHGFDNPPYERIAACPDCNSTDFFEYNPFTEKVYIAEQVLNVILMLNLYVKELKNIFGVNIKNTYLNESIGILAELIFEMFEFISYDIERKILCADSKKEIDQILLCLKGEI